MGTVIGGAAPLNMGALNLAALPTSRPQFSGPELIVFEADGGFLDEFRGSFLFAQAASAPRSLEEPDVKVLHHGEGVPGYPEGGLITSVAEFRFGVRVLYIADISVSADAVFDPLRSGRFETGMSVLLGANDEVFGSSFDDVLRGYDGDDVIVGGEGADWIDGDAGRDRLFGDDGADSIRGLADDDEIEGGAGNDDVNGNTGSDTVHGGAGADFVRGGQGADVVYGDDGDDPHVNGNIGDDRVFGGLGNDTVFGGQGADSLFGEAGDDLLSGDLGSDQLTGGAGADRFVLRVGSGLDWVLDFRAAEGDRVVIAPGATYTIITVSGQAVIDLGNGDQLGLVGVTVEAMGDWLVRG